MNDPKRVIITLAAVGSVAFVVFQLGNSGNLFKSEETCYSELKTEVDANLENLNNWQANPPEYVDYTDLEYAEMRVKYHEAKMVISNLKYDEYRDVCDYYLQAWELRLKKP